MLERPATIETQRLRLVALFPDEVEALVARDEETASQSAGVVFPSGWPVEPEAREGLEWHLRHLRANNAHIPWRIRVIVERASGRVIGSINLKGPPDATGDVEIGWGLVEDYRGRGYAFEAALAVVKWAAAQANARSVSATVPRHNGASERLAAKLGMVRSHETRRDLPLWRFDF